MAGAFKVTECLQVIKNLFAKPKYTKLNITMQAWIKLMCYINLVGSDEITGLGRIKDGTIVDFKIPNQVVTGTTADASDEDMLALLREIPVEEIEEWELDWHSHVDMEAFISGTDEANYELMSMAKGGKQFPLLVVNKRGEVCFKNFIHAGKCPDIELTLLKDELSDETIEGIYADCKEDVLAKVSKPKPKIKKETKPSWYGEYLKKQNIGSSKLFKKQEYHPTCSVCGVELVSQDEINAGLCDDCMTWGYNNYNRFGNY